MTKTQEEIIALYPGSYQLADNEGWERRIAIPGKSVISESGVVILSRRRVTVPLVRKPLIMPGDWACTCKAWLNRKSCEHVDSVNA